MSFTPFQPTDQFTMANFNNKMANIYNTVSVQVTVPASGWSLNSITNCYEQTVAVAGLLSTDTQATAMIYPVGNADPATQLISDTAYALWSTVGGYVACNVDGQMYMRCPPAGSKPSANFNVNVIMVR